MSLIRKFDEVYTAEGSLRPVYADLPRSLWQPPTAVSFGKAACQLMTFPLLIDESEYKLLAHGSRQRSRVKQLLFRDLILGEQSLLQENGGIIPGMVLERLLGTWRCLDTIREIWKNRGEGDICSASGPDIIRGTDGQWKVLEDNMGNLGGRTITRDTISAFREKTGQFEEVSFVDDFQTAVKKFLRLRNLEPGDERVVAMVGKDFGKFPDNENFAAPLRELGIKVLVKEEMTDEDLNPFYNGQIKAVIPFNMNVWPKGKKAFWRLFADTNIAFFEAPFAKMVGDKCFLPFMDELVRTLLKEECLLPSIHSTLLDQDCEREPMANSVYKVTGNCAGKGVFIVDEMVSDEQLELKRVLAEYPSWEYGRPLVIRQRREHASVMTIPGLGSCPLEIRLVNYLVGWDDIHIAENISAHALPSCSTDSRNHVTRGAYLIPTFRKVLQ